MIPQLRWIAGVAILIAAGCSGSRVLTLHIEPHKAECQGEALALCFLVRADPSLEPGFMSGPIHGFDFEWGTVYQVTVREIDLEGPIPADASSIRRELIRIDDATRVPAGTTFTLTLTTAEGRVVESAPGRFRFHSEHDFVCGSLLPCDELRTLIADGVRITVELAHVETGDAPLELRSWRPADVS